MNFRPWIPVIVFVLFTIGSCRYYVCEIKEKCGVELNAVESQDSNEPLAFMWSDDIPVTDSELDDYLSQIAGDIGEGQVLEITGQYFFDETNETDYSDLGLARAETVKDLLSELVDPAKLRVNSRPKDEVEGVREHSFASVEFEVRGIDIEQGEVLEMKDKVLILFPFKSTTKDSNPTIDAYLEHLAEKLIAEDGHVVIIGHTDTVGNADDNYKIGLRRAKNVRDILLKYGVSRSQITTESRGETEPVATNDNPVGRHQNRRVELALQ